MSFPWKFNFISNLMWLSTSSMLNPHPYHQIAVTWCHCTEQARLKSSHHVFHFRESKQKALQVQKKFIAISKRIPTKIKWVFVLHRSASQSCCCFIMFEACFLCSFTCFIYNNKKISHTARYQRAALLFMPRPLSAKYKMLQKSNLRFRMFFSASPLSEVGKVLGEYRMVFADKSCLQHKQTLNSSNSTTLHWFTVFTDKPNFKQNFDTTKSHKFLHRCWLFCSLWQQRDRSSMKPVVSRVARMQPCYVQDIHSNPFVNPSIACVLGWPQQNCGDFA